MSGTVDFLEPDDPACLRRLRALIEMLPECHESHESRECHAHARRSESSGETGSSSAGVGMALFYDMVSLDGRREYEMRDLLACIVDADSLQEYKAHYGKTLVCGYASIDGIHVGIVANQRRRCTTARGEVQIGGVIYGDAADKAARFVMDCNQTGLPLVFFQDVMGFMVGRDSEQQGIIRRGAKLVNAVSNSTVPKITVIVGGSFGAGHYALCGKAFDPCFIFAWPSAICRHGR